MTDCPGSGQRLCIVGQVIVDVTWTGGRRPTKLRLGGVAHAARMAWALGIDYTVAAVAPSYLVDAASDYLGNIGCRSFHLLAEVTGSPNVLLIGDAQEAGPQGYELLLREQAAISEPSLTELTAAIDEATDIIGFPDVSWFQHLVGAWPPVRSHLDIDPSPEMLELARQLPCVATLFTSTSAPSLHKYHGGSATSVLSACGVVEADVVVKENRGGSQMRCRDGRVIDGPAFPGRLVHSVGVGDAFDVGYVRSRTGHSESSALRYASLLAHNYGSTTDPDVLRKLVTGTTGIPPSDMDALPGLRLPWDVRSDIHVYLAGPDFPHFDTALIDAVEAALTYHNFTPRRPIVENGLITDAMDASQRATIINADLALLAECSVLVAVMLSNDPGTLVEVGIAIERQMPVVVYDPLGIARNPMLTEQVFSIEGDLNGTISSVFAAAAMLRVG